MVPSFPKKYGTYSIAAGVALQFACATTHLDERCIVDVVPAQSPSCLEDVAGAEREWKAFRADYQGLTQGLAISSPLAGGCRVLIMAEPPPDVSLADLKRVAPGLLGNARTYERKIGVDGWIKDAVAVLPPVDDEVVDELIAALSFLMHKSAYGAAVLPYGNGRPRAPFFLGEAHDLHVAPQELMAWLTKEQREVQDRLLGTVATVDGLLADPEPGIYHTGELVLWPLRRNGNVEEQRVFARRFAVDSDLIVGGLLGSQGLLVVGRARAVPVERLPPMRPETLLSLAGASTNELGQSYERTRPLAGKLSDGSDWGPAMLSEQLHDTEFGWLLNFTDNILKSWSNNGVVRYRGYEWYPEPGRWPFDEPVFDKFRKLGKQQVVFNWNTQDRAVALFDDKRVAVTFNSTGALPMEYIPEGIGLDASSLSLTTQGATYFSSLGDPNLIRVAQYVSFFQLARLAGLTGPQREERPDLERRQQVLQDHFERAFAAVKTGDPAIETRLRRMVAQAVAQSGEGVPASREPVEDIVKAMMDAAHLLVKGFASSLGEIGASAFNHDLQARTPEHVAFAIELLQLCGSVFLAAVDQTQMLDEYVTAGSQSLSPWMHTPTVVRSRLLGDKYSAASGGHNVSAQVRGAVAKRDDMGRLTPVAIDGAAIPKFASVDTLRSERQALGRRTSAPELPQQVRSAPSSSPVQSNEIVVEKRDDGFAVVSDGVERVVSNRVLASEIVGQVWTAKARRSHGADIKLNFQKMTPGEVEAVSTTLASQSVIKSDAYLKKLAFGRRASTKNAEKIFGERFDLDTVRVGKMKVHESVKGETLVETTVEAVRAQGRQHSRWFKIKMFFKEQVTKPLLGRLTRLIDDTFKRLGDRTPRTIDAVEELQREFNVIKRSNPGMRFEIHLDDIFLTLEEPAANRSGEVVDEASTEPT